MKPGYSFFLNSILLGIGLAMDAFSVSCANALREPGMRRYRMCSIAGVYAFFQFLMPLTGWLCVHTIEERFSKIQNFIPWIALVLLVWIGGNMLLEGIREERQSKGRSSDRTKFPCSGRSSSEPPSEADIRSSSGNTSEKDIQSSSETLSGADTGSTSASSASGALTVPVLLLQGIATSIDALSTGFTIAEYNFRMAFAACLIIAAVTFVICIGGLMIGRKAGSRLSGKAGILGGVILIAIGLEIVITHYI